MKYYPDGYTIQSPGVSFGETHYWNFYCPGDNSLWDSDNIPDQILHDHAVTVSVKFKNTGTTTWTAAAGYGLLYRNVRVAMVSGSVPPGGIATFAFPINVHTPGTYSYILAMSRNNVRFPYGEIASGSLTVT
jgi:hypothetical protein